MYSKFEDNIWAAHLSKMISLPSFNCGAKYLFCVIDVFSKTALVKPLRDKKAKIVLDGFVEIAK